jgi:hypothetical protein
MIRASARFGRTHTEVKGWGEGHIQIRSKDYETATYASHSKKYGHAICKS